MSSWSLRPHFRDKSISIKPRAPNVPKEEVSPQVSTTFTGVHYRLATNWNTILPLKQYNKPITYLEIGTFYGANLLSVADSYASHQDSILHCIDPWEDYDDYNDLSPNAQRFTNASFVILSTLAGAFFSMKFSHQL